MGKNLEKHSFIQSPTTKWKTMREYNIVKNLDATFRISGLLFKLPL